MSQFVEQVKHNESFHESLCSNFTNQFFDWKITCLFYCAFHLVKELARFRKVEIGNKHTEILRSLNPKNPNRPMPFKSDAFDAFDQLFEYSCAARYNGFTDFDTFQELKKKDYEESLKLYSYIKKYIVSQGVIL